MCIRDRDELVKELSASKETFESHLERMVDRENELRTQYDSVVSSLE